MKGYWKAVAGNGRDLNPYRGGYLQLLVISEMKAKIEEKYYGVVSSSYYRCLHVLDYFGVAPAYVTMEISKSLKSPFSFDMLGKLNRSCRLTIGERERRERLSLT